MPITQTARLHYRPAPSPWTTYAVTVRNADGTLTTRLIRALSQAGAVARAVRDGDHVISAGRA